MATPLRWGLLAAGSIARTFANALRTTPNATLTAVAARDGKRAAAFAADYHDQFPQLNSHADYDALIEDPNVDVIYIATPHPEHARWTLRALEAGKHVLCEKPAGMSHAEVMAMVEGARRNRRFFMEAFMYRCHPQTLALKALVDKGVIGELRHLQASFGFNAPLNPDHRLFNAELGGGGILDVGCYPLSMVRYLTNQEPQQCFAHGRLGATGVDVWATAQLTFARGVSAQIGAGVELLLDNRVHLYGSSGQLTVGNPWHCADRDGRWKITLRKAGAEAEVVEGTAAPLYQLEAEEVARCLATGALESPRMSWQDSLNNAIGLDRWRQAIGLRYDLERRERHRGPLRGSMKSPRRELPQLTLPVLDRPVSRLVMGCDNQPSMAHASALWDHFFESGGNCFDTAWLYGDGSMEQLLGTWHQARKLRDELVFIGKGAHTPHCTPEAVHQQLDESLERLQTDHVDIYFMHRDNPDVPVGEFVSALNAERDLGRLRCFGGSNWSLPRLQEANAWAKRQGLEPFRVLSNQFSLAQMVRRIWAGTETATKEHFRHYLAAEQIALFPWSAQARGFFTAWVDDVLRNHGHPEERIAITTMQPNAQELEHTWFSEDNFARRERARQLAEERGVSMIQVALAYVAAQPFPCFPLIGPRVIDETRSCIAALELTLSASETAWLETGQTPGT